MAAARTLTVIVKNVAAKGVQNLGVEATGPSGTATTKLSDTSGCAIFGAVESGAYSIRLDQSGWMGTNCVQQAIKTANVAITLGERVVRDQLQISPEHQARIVRDALEKLSTAANKN